MTFNDIIKKTVIENMQNNSLSMTNANITIGICILFSLYIYFIYYAANKKSFYSKQFGITLAVLPVITAGIIMAMQSNLVVSLGMVGALSIVRFRTAVKEPKDMVFLFWSISIGIICGAGLYEVALISSLVVTVLILVLENLPVSKAPMMLVVNLQDAKGEEELLETVKQYCKFYKVKSRNYASGKLDMVIEVRVKKEASLASDVSKLSAVYAVSLISHDGEVTF